MDRDIFQRPFRMTFRFGRSEEEATVQGTFDLPKPKRPDDLCSPQMTTRTHGGYIQEGLSPIAKPNGQLATRGGHPDALVGDAMGSGAGMTLASRIKRK